MGSINTTKSIIIPLTRIVLDQLQIITVILVKELATGNTYISVGNITYNTIKSAEVYLDNKLIAKTDSIDRDDSGILDVTDTEVLVKSSELKIVITYENNASTGIIITGRPLKDVIDKLNAN